MVFPWRTSHKHPSPCVWDGVGWGCWVCWSLLTFEIVKTLHQETMNTWSAILMFQQIMFAPMFVHFLACPKYVLQASSGKIHPQKKPPIDAGCHNSVSLSRVGKLCVLLGNCKRAVLRIEPKPSRTLSDNHATRPNSQLKNYLKWKRFFFLLLLE